MISYEEFLSSLSTEDQADIRKRGRELAERALSLQSLRAAIGVSQKTVAEALGVQQPRISKFEKTALQQVSALREYLAALGAELELCVRVNGQRYRLDSDVSLEDVEDIVQDGPNFGKCTPEAPSFLQEARRQASNNVRWFDGKVRAAQDALSEAA